MDKETYEALRRIMSVVHVIAGKDIDAFIFADVEQVEMLVDKVAKEYEELSPVVGSGTYHCEFEDCKVTQTDDSVGDVLFYGSDDGIYCKRHLQNETEYHFTATITHCAMVLAKNENEAKRLVLDEFNDGERLSEIIINDEDIELEK